MKFYSSLKRIVVDGLFPISFAHYAGFRANLSTDPHLAANIRAVILSIVCELAKSVGLLLLMTGATRPFSFRICFWSFQTSSLCAKRTTCSNFRQTARLMSVFDEFSLQVARLHHFLRYRMWGENLSEEFLRLYQEALGRCALQLKVDASGASQRLGPSLPMAITAIDIQVTYWPCVLKRQGKLPALCSSSG